MYVALNIPHQEITEHLCGVGKSEERCVTNAARNVDTTRSGTVNMIQLDGEECTS